MKWLDSRIYSPPTTRYDRYIVAFLSFSDVVSIGTAEWIPKNQYTEGDWGQIFHTNGNKSDSTQVLYWMKHPKEPELK